MDHHRRKASCAPAPNDDGTGGVCEVAGPSSGFFSNFKVPYAPPSQQQEQHHGHNGQNAQHAHASGFHGGEGAGGGGGAASSSICGTSPFTASLPPVYFTLTPFEQINYLLDTKSAAEASSASARAEQ